MAFSFEDLRVYRRAEDCLVRVYRVAAALPDSERFNLTQQLRRSGLSAVLNTAESTERRSRRDAAHFIVIALGSVVEVTACLRVAERLYDLPQPLIQEARQEYEILYRQLHAYRRSLIRQRS